MFGCVGIWVSAVMSPETLPSLSIVDLSGSPRETPSGPSWPRPATNDPWGHEHGEDDTGLLSPDGHVKTHAEKLALAKLLQDPKPLGYHSHHAQHQPHHFHLFGSK